MSARLLHVDLVLKYGLYKCTTVLSSQILPVVRTTVRTDTATVVQLYMYWTHEVGIRRLLRLQIEQACAAEANSRLTQISSRGQQLFPPGRGQQTRDCLSIKGDRHKPDD